MAYIGWFDSGLEGKSWFEPELNDAAWFDSELINLGAAPSAISAANITTGSDAVGGTSFTTASVTLAANKLGLLTVASRMNSSVTPNTPTITGWTLIGAIEFDTGAPSQKKISLFRRLSGSASTSTHVIDFAGQSQTHCDWVIDELTNTDTSGTNGSGAIVQSVTNKDETLATPALTVTLAAFASTSNATYGTFAHGGTVATNTVGTGFTFVASNTGYHKIATEFRSDNDTTVDMSSNSNDQHGGIAIEVKLYSAGGATVIALNLITMGFSRPAQQLKVATSLATKTMSSWVAQALQTKTATGLSTRAMSSWLPKATQPATVVNLATKAMASWIAQALTWSNIASGTVITLTLASLSFLAKTLQTATRTTTTLASFGFLAKTLQPRVAVSLALRAMSSWLPKALQPKLASSLAVKAMSSWLAKTAQTATRTTLGSATFFFQAKILSYIEGNVVVAVVRIRLAMTRFREVLKKRDY